MIKETELKEIPRWLYDKEGKQYVAIMERHRDGFNLVTHRLNYSDYLKE